jgi:hypothetical protein
MCNCRITLAILVTDREIILPDTGSHDEAYRWEKSINRRIRLLILY